MKKLSIVVPVFNEEANISIFYNRIADMLKTSEVMDWEMIFVDDGSWDKSRQIIKEIIKKDGRIKLISLTRNFGQQSAMTAGMDYASGDIIITMDCDLQDPPELIPQMLSELKDEVLVVFARRRSRKDGFFKKLSAGLYYAILRRFSDIKITGNIGDFRMIDRRVLSELKNMREKSRYLRGMVAWLGFNYTIVDYDRPNRLHGKTGFSYNKMLRLAMDGILNFSLLPLRIGMLIGSLSILVGSFFLAYMGLDILFTDVSYPLYKWLIVVLFVLIGFLFVLIWIIAEYVGKIYDESKGRPLYVIHDRENFEQA